MPVPQGQRREGGIPLRGQLSVLMLLLSKVSTHSYYVRSWKDMGSRLPKVIHSNPICTRQSDSSVMWKYHQVLVKETSLPLLTGWPWTCLLTLLNFPFPGWTVAILTPGVRTVLEGPHVMMVGRQSCLRLLPSRSPFAASPHPALWGILS